MPTTIAVGQSATLSWQTSNATTVTLNGATVSVDGALTVSPTTTTNYDLLADGVSRRLTLTVTPAPPPPPGEQAPGTWQKLVFPTQNIYQPLLGGDQNLTEGQPGAAYTNCPRPIQTNGAGIFRSYSGVLIANGDLLVMGGGHAGHPGNDLQTIDYVNAARTYPFVAECPPAYNPDGTPNSIWRGIRGGAVMTGGLSPTGKPWVQHMYMNHAWDSIRGRYLVINGNGLQAYTFPTAGKPEGEWTILAGTNKDVSEVVWGSAGGIIFDDVRDSVWLFVSTSGNGAARGIYEYRFDASGAVIVKRFVRAWPSTLNWNWAYNLITAMYAKERREAILVVTPSSTTTSNPRNRIWRFNLDSEAPPVWDQSWVPGTPQYDQVFATDDTRARLVTRLPGQTWLMLATGAWIQNDDDGGTWAWLAMPGAPNLAWWTFACDPDSVYCVGLSSRSSYGVPGTSSGGISDLWRYRRP